MANKVYKQKDLGWPRTPTTERIHTRMPDGSLWSVPAQLVVDAMDAYYCNEQDIVGNIKAGYGNWNRVIEFGKEKLTWDHVKDYATRVVDYQDGWANGEKTVVC